MSAVSEVTSARLPLVSSYQSIEGWYDCPWTAACGGASAKGHPRYASCMSEVIELASGTLEVREGEHREAVYGSHVAACIEAKVCPEHGTKTLPVPEPNDGLSSGFCLECDRYWYRDRNGNPCFYVGDQTRAASRGTGVPLTTSGTWNAEAFA